MSTRHWLEISGVVRGSLADRLADRLLESGALAVDVADPHAETEDEQPLFGEPGMAHDARWEQSRLAALFEPEQTPEVLTALWTALQQEFPQQLGAPEFRLVPETDWVRATQAQFAPIQVGPRFWIVPSWCEPVDPQAINLRLDPGLAFGSGTHPTTRLCLEWLCARDLTQASVLDYGCGSGILALAARALGARQVLGVDIDPLAVSTAQDNARANRLDGPGLSFSDSNTPLLGTFGIVLANILAGPLTVLAPALSAHVAPGGWLVLAGILPPQVERIQAAYAPWLALEVSAQREGWVLLTGRRLAEAA